PSTPPIGAWPSTTSGGPRSGPRSSCRSSAGCCHWWSAPRGTDRHTGYMPKPPEVEPLPAPRRRPAVGKPIGRIDVAALSVLKTFDPPINALHGVTVTGADRWGKYLGMRAGGLIMITHLSRAGWLRWSEKLSAAPLKPGK